MNALVLQPQLSGSRRPPAGSDFRPTALGPDPDDAEHAGTLLLLRNVELSLDERRIKTRMDADNLLAVLEMRELQVEQELAWSRLINPSVIRSLNGEVESLDALLSPEDKSEEMLTLLLKRIQDLRSRLMAVVDAPN